jgi:hypothetical protein
MTDDTPDDTARQRTETEPTAAEGDDPGTAAAADPTVTDEADATADEADADEADGDRLRRYVERAVLAVLFLFAIVVAFRFYFAASNAVSYWVAEPYESAFQAAFNLVVLLVVGAGIVRQVRRMR